MATKENKKADLISEIMILIFAILCIALVVADLSANLSEVVRKRRERVEMKAVSKELSPITDFSPEDLPDYIFRGD
jgi:hypothetical protein